MVHVPSDDDATGATPVDESVLPSMGYRAYVLLIVGLISTVSALDRQILDILVEPIRHEFGLSDRDIGMLNGVAYAGIFALASIPVARLADRFARRTVIAIAVMFWSCATALSGATTSFAQLFMTRMAVGLGEAGLASPGPALLSDIFPRRQRGTVTSLYMLGPPLGIGLAYAVGGWALQNYGWRSAFLVAAVPGLILGPIAFFTIRNIRKGLADGVTKTVAQPSLGQTFKAIVGIKTLMFMIAGLSLQGIFTSGIQRWFPAYLERSMDLSPATFGAHLGFAAATGNFIGHLAGGPLADLLGRRDMRLQMVIGVIAVVGCTLATLAAFTTATPGMFYLFAGLQYGLAGLFAAPLIMICTSLPPVWARATTAATTLMAVYLIGYGIGPGIVGALSDALVATHGKDSLRLAILWVLVLSIPSVVCFYLASRHYKHDLARADAFLKEQGGA